MTNLPELLDRLFFDAGENITNTKGYREFVIKGSEIKGLKKSILQAITTWGLERDALLIARIEEKRLPETYQVYNKALDDIVTLIKGEQTASLPPQEQQEKECECHCHHWGAKHCPTIEIHPVVCSHCKREDSKG